MDVSYILDGLNDAQREAVCAPQGNMLVLAGAGSGKTRVLVHRIAWLIQIEGVSPHGIIAVTFTNKAAGEMRARIENLLHMPVRGMWVGTFHSLAHRLLRLHWQDAGLPQTFQILDSDDQYRVIRRVMRAMDLDEAKWPPKQVQWYINGRKDEGQRPHNIEHFGDPFDRQMVRIYEAYEEVCQRSGMVDFAELLLRVQELFLGNEHLLKHYQQRFQHILVDEFQDTNTIQYAWVRLLAGKTGKVFAVGDDDQSIYGWRGARIENIQQFSNDFPETKLVRLEQNYRSTGNILSAANALIAKNFSRLGKNLWTADSDGDPLHLYTAFNEIDEARFVVEQIQQWVDQGGAHSETAVLYRSNAQSRVIEEALIQMSVPYRVYGGLRFFERQEIKDALAYVRLMANPFDDASFERVVNTPTRGIGEKTLEAVRNYARTNNVPMMQAAHAVVDEKLLSARALTALKNFLQLIQRLQEETDGLALHELVEHVIHRSTLFDHYDKDKSEKGQARIENLEELVNAAKYFEFDPDEEEGLDELSAFLAHAALEAGEEQSGSGQDCVQLMTLHSAKGLEFNLVFLCGVEEDLFPHKRSAEDPVRLEEERRLCYVGITRAKERLYITHAETRRLYGSETYPRASRFVHEIPNELIHEVRLRGSVSQPMFAKNQDSEEQDTAGFRLGQRVFHAKFGEGIVLNFEGQGSHARVQVNFDEAGSKWLVVAYANLQVAETHF
jgi:DNA helicase-2/ATP-dependent DNA helicase PcrA